MTVEGFLFYGSFFSSCAAKKAKEIPVHLKSVENIATIRAAILYGQCENMENHSVKSAYSAKSKGHNLSQLTGNTGPDMTLLTYEPPRGKTNNVVSERV